MNKSMTIEFKFKESDCLPTTELKMYFIGKAAQNLQILKWDTE
jgi:hypothetical protein